MTFYQIWLYNASVVKTGSIPGLYINNDIIALIFKPDPGLYH